MHSTADVYVYLNETDAYMSKKANSAKMYAKCICHCSTFDA